MSQGQSTASSLSSSSNGARYIKILNAANPRPKRKIQFRQPITRITVSIRNTSKENRRQGKSPPPPQLSEPLEMLADKLPHCKNYKQQSYISYENKIHIYKKIIKTHALHLSSKTHHHHRNPQNHPRHGSCHQAALHRKLSADY